jgi:hypothetical protein
LARAGPGARPIAFLALLTACCLIALVALVTLKNKSFGAEHADKCNL